MAASSFPFFLCQLRRRACSWIAGALLAQSSADPGRRADSSRGPHLPHDEAPASGSSVKQGGTMLRMISSVCTLVGILAAQALAAQTAPARTDARAPKP